MSINVQVFLCHKDEVEEFARQNSPWLLFLHETHVTQDVEDIELEIEGYNIVRCNTESSHTGGVLIYIKKQQQRYRIEFHNLKSMEYWAVGITNAIKKEKYYIGCIYHSLSGSCSRFLDFFEEWQEMLIDSGKNIVVTGDFNINWFSDVESCRIRKIVQMCGLKQVVKEATRISTRYCQYTDTIQTSSTLIDLVMTNN